MSPIYLYPAVDLDTLDTAVAHEEEEEEDNKHQADVDWKEYFHLKIYYMVFQSLRQPLAFSICTLAFQFVCLHYKFRLVPFSPS